MNQIPSDLLLSPPPFDALTAYGIGGLAVGVSAYTGWLYHRATGSGFLAGVFFMGLFAVTGMAAKTGVLSNLEMMPPPPLLIGLLVLGLPFVLAFSRVGSRFVEATPLIWLVGLQAFRFPLELIMHRSSKLGICINELTFSGYNFDILTGLAAIGLVILMKIKGSVSGVLLWGFNIFGLACLAAIAVIGIGGSPVIRMFGDAPERINSWILYAPYVWLPTVLVVIAMTTHLVSIRKLRAGG